MTGFLRLASNFLIFFLFLLCFLSSLAGFILLHFLGLAFFVLMNEDCFLSSKLISSCFRLGVFSLLSLARSRHLRSALYEGHFYYREILNFCFKDLELPKLFLARQRRCFFLTYPLIWMIC